MHRAIYKGQTHIVIEKPDPDSARQRLLDLRAELQSELAAAQDATKPVELDQQSIGRLSRMDAMQNQAMAQAANNRRNAQLKRIEIALKDIETGEYGYCKECGDEIETNRLAFDPTTSKCKDCAHG